MGRTHHIVVIHDEDNVEVEYRVSPEDEVEILRAVNLETGKVTLHNLDMFADIIEADSERMIDATRWQD